jgi:hypothetical protein
MAPAMNMVRRVQTWLFILLLVSSAAMGVVLWQLREHAHKRLLAGQDTAPTQAPEISPEERATLLVANDADSSLLPQELTLPLPQDMGSRARVILGKLLDLYALPGATHPVPGGAASIGQVFLLPAVSLNGPLPTVAPAARNPGSGPGSGARGASSAANPAAAKNARTVAPEGGPQLAVVNLTSAFAASHPSGIEAETLTVLSICGTLHANLPRVTQVRFLVDGQPSATLAGHADLTRTYLAADAAPSSEAHP